MSSPDHQRVIAKPADSTTDQVIKLSSPATREFWEIPILFEDEHLLALDKPAGLSTGTEKNDLDRPNLMSLLHRGIADARPWAKIRALTYLMNAHRLEAEASGVLLLAKAKPSCVRLLDFFGSEQPSLWFLTLVEGVPAEDRFSIEANLAPDPVRAGLMRVDSRSGKRARTLFEVSERFAGWTLLKCAPLTSRPHQVRVHLRRAGLPVVGDECYGGKPLWLSKLKRDFHLKPKHSQQPLLNRVCLHAEQLALAHPVTSAPLVIHAPWPRELLVAVKYLRRYAAL